MNNLGLRLLKKLLKANKFGFKTIGLLNLIFATGNFLNFKPTNFEKIDIPSLIKLLLETALENIEKQALGKFKKLFLFLTDFVRKRKNDQTKLDLIDVFLSFYFNFLAFSEKAINSKDFFEKRDSFSKVGSMTKFGESFKGIFPDDTKKNHLKIFAEFKELILMLIQNGFQLDIIQYKENKEESNNSVNNNKNASPAVNFLMVFAKNYLSKLSISEFSSMEIAGNSEILGGFNNKTENFVVTEEKNVFLLIRELLKRNESDEFRTFLFEMINSKLKLKIKGNHSKQQNLTFKLLIRFNVKAAMFIRDIDTFRKVIFDLFNKYEEVEEEDMKSFILGVARKAAIKLKDKGKIAFLLNQESMRFCKVFFLVNIFL